MIAMTCKCSRMHLPFNSSSCRCQAAIMHAAPYTLQCMELFKHAIKCPLSLSVCAMRHVLQVCGQRGHKAGFVGAVYVDCPNKPCYLCKQPGHTTATCPHNMTLNAATPAAAAAAAGGSRGSAASPAQLLLRREQVGRLLTPCDFVLLFFCCTFCNNKHHLMIFTARVGHTCVVRVRAHYSGLACNASVRAAGPPGKTLVQRCLCSRCTRHRSCAAHVWLVLLHACTCTHDTHCSLVICYRSVSFTQSACCCCCMCADWAAAARAAHSSCLSPLAD
jgi:hypothetical protein